MSEPVQKKHKLEELKYSYGKRGYTLFSSKGKEYHKYPLNPNDLPYKDMYGKKLPSYLYAYKELRLKQRNPENIKYSYGDKGFTTFFPDGTNTYTKFSEANYIPPIDMYDNLYSDINM